MKSRRVKRGNLQSATGGAEPVASSTPNVKHPPPKSGSLKSEDAVMFSPGLSSVSFSHDRVRSKHLSSAATPSGTGNDTDELYLDAVDIDPTAAIGPEMLRLFSRSTSHPNGEGKSATRDGSTDQMANGGRLKEVESQVHGTGSTSSEGFATPSPTPPRKPSIATSQLLPIPDDSTMQDISSSFKTACDLSLVDEEGEGAGSSATSRDARGHKTKPTEPSGETRAPGRSRYIPDDQPLAWNTWRCEDDSDNDFVDSEDIEAILRRVAKEKKNRSTVPSTSYSPPPPPVPKRGVIAAAPLVLTPASGPAVETPPTPPVRGDSTRGTFDVGKEAGKDGTLPPPVPLRLQGQPSEAKDDGPMVTGILDHPEGYPYLPRKAKEQNDRGEKLLLVEQSGVTGKGKPRNTWIYDTLKRSDKYTVPGEPAEVSGTRGVVLEGSGGEEGERGNGERTVLSPASHNHATTCMPPEEVCRAVGGVTGRNGLNRRFDDGDYEEIDDGADRVGMPEKAKAPDWVNIENPVVPDRVRLEAGRPNGRDRVSIETEQPRACNGDISTRPAKTRADDNDYEEIDDDVNPMSSKTDSPKTPNQDMPARPAKPVLDKDYEEIDDIMSGTDSDTSARLAKSSKPQFKDTNDRESEGKADDGVEDVGAASKEGATSASDDDRDIGNAALYLEHDEEIHDTDESKNSSMTVTLDLSHIAKDDIIYGSRDKKMSTSVDRARIAIDNDESSAEEAGDGTVTPIEMTYNESMLGLVKAKLEQQRRTAEALKPVARDENRNGTGLNDSVEYSSLPDEVFMNSQSELEDSLPDPAIGKAREKARTWLPRTMDRRNVVSCS